MFNQLVRQYKRLNKVKRRLKAEQKFYSVKLFIYICIVNLIINQFNPIIMAKNYEAMSTKKLKALLETETEENVVLINEVLNKREGVKAQATPAHYEAEPEGELTEAEQKAIDEAEAAFEAKKADEKPAPTTKSDYPNN